jgi:hypothetical protein
LGSETLSVTWLSVYTGSCFFDCAIAFAAIENAGNDSSKSRLEMDFITASSRVDTQNPKDARLDSWQYTSRPLVESVA